MVYNNLFSGISCLLLAVSISACAQGKKSTARKSGGKYAKLIAAAKQEHLPGAPGMEPTVNYMFVIIWNKATPPESFFWRGADGWMPCMVSKAKYTPNAANNGFPFDRAPIKLKRFERGDTLMIVPAKRAKDVMPESISADTRNTLFFKTAGTSWLALPVDNIKELPKEIGQ
ncbi:MAG: hypothetical protein EOP56_14885 [Sphingobacteriales bacterium]|nr:MAG: hypothetical protein EOP56_14885 [Sphingobacteriales bacterium]